MSDQAPSTDELKGGFLFGQIARELGFVDTDQIKLAIAEQRQRRADGKQHKQIGELLILNDALNLRNVMKVLLEQKKRRENSSGTDGLPLTRVGPYEIISVLGSGGMGTVYQARDTALDRIIALKVLSIRLTEDVEFSARFQREVQTTGALSHPNIVGGFGSGSDDGRPFLAMEFVDGQSLGKLLESGGRMDEMRALQVAREVVLALEHAHAHGVVHRDVKPDNVLLGRDGCIKLTDFGLAKLLREDQRLTQSGIALGTPHYISPEQVSASRYIDHRADLYSLGAMLYQMVTGVVPFDGPNNNEIMLKHLNEELRFPARLKLSPGLVAVISRLMAKKATQRYYTCAHVIEDFDLLLKSEPPVNATAADRSSTRMTPVKGKRGCLPVALISILVLLIGNWCNRR